MTSPVPAAVANPEAPARPPSARRWLWAALRATRPRQWPKNLLVLAAPLAGASLGRPDGLGYALVAVAAFVAASSAVYLVNDTVDAERDRRHPVKRNRPIASGALPARHAVLLAVAATAAALAAGAVIGGPWLIAAVAGYLALSFLYSLRLKHVPFVELGFVASGFLLRVLGGAAATHVRPSGWFLLVCSLGALMVAITKRSTELRSLGPEAARHRPAMRFYRESYLRAAGLVTAGAMAVCYVLWALGEPGPGMRTWHLISAVPLVAALARFSVLARRGDTRPIEDLITRDRLMAAAELAWLVAFAIGLKQ
ncbi:MAG TPA: decaprenyl-phosphate phosphoribosyltransferase [Streptosporangiaceae bacterium]